MFTQTKNEIVYREERWVNWMIMGFMAPLVAGLTYLVEISMGWKGSPALALLPAPVPIAVPPIVAAIVTCYVIAKVSYLDRLSITTEGLSYYHSDSIRHYPWSQLHDLLFVECGRGSGYYRINITNDDKPIRVNLAPFGIYRTEFEEVISSARHGTLPNVRELHDRIEAEKDRKNAKFLKLAVTAIGIICLSSLGLSAYRNVRQRMHSHAGSLYRAKPL